MEPFVHMREYPFVICKTCRFVCVAKEVPSYLKEWHVSISVEERKTVTEKVGLIPGIVQDQAGLEAFKFPPPTVDPIPFIAPPESNGFRCNEEECQYVARTARGIQKHYRQKHG